MPYMSGHSKWAQIKRAKGANDAKRAQQFTKLAHVVTIAAKQGGGDPEMNFSLRLAIDRAKAANMPKDNIDRAIKRGSGELEGGELHELNYEAFGPEGVALIIEALTDNTNRSASDVKHVLTKHAGNLGGPGTTMWMFERRGVLSISREDLGGMATSDVELLAIDAGAEDLLTEDEGITIYTKPSDLMKIKQEMEHQTAVSDANIQWIPKTRSQISETTRQKIHALVEALEELDDVTNVHTSL